MAKTEGMRADVIVLGAGLAGLTAALAAEQAGADVILVGRDLPSLEQTAADIRALGRKADVLVLGCTHYPLLKKEISGYLRGVKIIDSAQAVSIHTQEIIAQCNIFNNRRRRGRVEFYVSDAPKGFAKMAKLFLGREIAIPKVVNV